MTQLRIIKWLAGFSGLCVILLFAIGFLLPRILDSQAAKEQIRAFTIGGNGRVDFENDTIDARGLGSVRIPGDTITRRIPVVGSILGGSILGIPVWVTGSLERPDVTYLSASAVGAELLNHSEEDPWLTP